MDLHISIIWVRVTQRVRFNARDIGRYCFSIDLNQAAIPSLPFILGSPNPETDFIVKHCLTPNDMITVIGNYTSQLVSLSLRPT
jgi:hypothetical protein